MSNPFEQFGPQTATIDKPSKNPFAQFDDIPDETLEERESRLNREAYEKLLKQQTKPEPEPEKQTEIKVSASAINPNAEGGFNYGGKETKSPVSPGATGRFLSEELLPTLQAPFVELPRFTVNPDDSKTKAGFKAAANLIIGLPEFLESPLGIVTGGAASAFPRTVASVFLADTGKSVVEGAKEAGANWDEMTPAQRTEAIVNLGGMELLAAAMAHGTGAGKILSDTSAGRAVNGLSKMLKSGEIAPLAKSPEPAAKSAEVPPSPTAVAEVPAQPSASKPEILPRAQQAVGREPKAGEYRVTDEMTPQEVRDTEAKANQEIADAWPDLDEIQREAMRRGKPLHEVMREPEEPLPTAEEEKAQAKAEREAERGKPDITNEPPKPEPEPEGDLPVVVPPEPQPQKQEQPEVTTQADLSLEIDQTKPIEAQRNQARRILEAIIDKDGRGEELTEREAKLLETLPEGIANMERRMLDAAKQQPVNEPTEQQTAKEPWQMTKADWEARDKALWGDLSAEGTGLNAARTFHRLSVRDAIKEGKPVPPEVLADYPDLAPKPEETGIVPVSKITGIEKLVELTEDQKDDPRYDEPGITRATTPNKIVIQLRDLESNPIREVEIEPTGDRMTDAQNVVDRIKDEARDDRNVSIRESGGVSTDERGHAIYHYTDSPNGPASALASDLIKARQQKNAPKPETVFSKGDWIEYEDEQGNTHRGIVDSVVKRGRIIPGAGVQKPTIEYEAVDEAGNFLPTPKAGTARRIEKPQEQPKSEVTKENDEIRNLITVKETAQQKAAKIKKLAEKYGLTVKEMQERIEAEVVRLADELARYTTVPKNEIFKSLVAMYDNQPVFSSRTSTSVADQAYSTPLPLAYALNHAIGEGKKAYEPTAGNGALLIGDDLANSHANEKNPTRIKHLKDFGIGTVTENDATKFTPEGKFDAVKANPPFGAINNVNIGGFGIKRLEHLISLKALDAMNDDGRGYVILGAALHSSETGRGAQRIFENYLYSRYNVVGNFEVSGDLYSRQGASFPVRVLVVDGRRAEPLPMGEYSPKSVERLTSWEQLWKESERIKDEITKNEALRPSGDAPISVPPERGPKPTKDGGDSATGTGKDSAPSGKSGKAGGNRGGKSSSGTESTGGRTDKPSSGATEPPENGDRPTDTTGKPGVSSGGVEGGNGGSGKTPTDAGKGGATGGEKPDAGNILVKDRVKKPPTVKDTEFQVAYEPKSDAASFGTLIPKSISQGVSDYLTKLKKNKGSLDEYVAAALELPVDHIKKTLSAEQIDGVAMAIDQIETGGATIIGDQTGIGKGRQAAAVIIYGMKKGAIPVFFTKDPKLFSDMFSDIADVYGFEGPKQVVGMVKPLILGDPGKASIVDTEGNTLVRSLGKAGQDKAIAKIQSSSFTEAGYNAVFSTYSQVNFRNERQFFLERLANENPIILVMDEAHEAAGNGETSMQAAFFTGGMVRRGSGSNMVRVSVPGILRSRGVKTEGGGGVLYLSATFAKRPENMPVYFRTSISKSSDSFDAIVRAMERGGVALQQAVSEALSKAGQYTRREREFTGVSYDMKKIQVADEGKLIEQVDQVTDVLQQIVEFSKEVREAQEGSTAMTEAQISMTDFASVVHNQIGQLLLAAKADHVVAEALDAVKRGEKPVVALMNTMESFLEQYATDKEIKPGKNIKIRWNELLKYALSRTLRYSEELPNGDTVIRQIDPDEIGLGELFRSVEDAADAIEVEFPISPIDYIIQKLAKNGVAMSELTGRQSGLKYINFETGEAQYYKFQKANKNKVVNEFNNGTTKGMLLNASGSTGLSAHASEKFKDQSPRTMLIAQPAADINVFVQTLGRIFRTGLVMKGKDAKGNPYGARYIHLTLPLQAELRPAAMAARKMKSLNANTTAEADNAIKIESEDLMNRYGDAVVTEYLDQNQLLQDMLNIQIEEKNDGNPKVKRDVAREFTGRMARMPDDWQKKAYEEIIPAYRQLIEQLKANGEYDLEIVTHDTWDATRRSDTELSAGTDESNIFTSSVRLQEWDISDKRHVPSGAEMEAEAKKNLGTPEQTNSDFQKFVREAEGKIKARESELFGIMHSTKTSETEKNKAGRALKLLGDSTVRWTEKTKKVLADVINHAGDIVELENMETGDSFNGMLVDVRYPKNKNVAPSGFQFKFFVDAPGGVVFINASHITPDKWSIKGTWKQPGEFKGGVREARYTRNVITGNPIKAYTSTNGRGKMVRFISRDGELITGLLMPRNWDVSKLANDPRLDLLNGHAVEHYLKNSFEHSPTVESGGIVSIIKDRYRDSYKIRTGAARRAGGNVYLDEGVRRVVGDFTKVGNRMEVEIGGRKLIQAVEAIRNVTQSQFRAKGKAEELSCNVKSANDYAKSISGGNKAGGTGAVGFPAAAAPVPPTPPPAAKPGTTMIQGGYLPATLDRTGKGSVSVPQIMDSMQRVLKASGSDAGLIRTGHFFANARGIWKPHAEIVRMKEADNIPTASHEVAHGIQQLVFGDFKSSALKSLEYEIRKELIGLGKALYGSRKPVAGYTGEGFAEFVRYWLTTDDAATVAPKMTEFFEKKFLPAHPEIADALNEARSLVTTWRGQGSIERARRQVMREPGRFARIAEALVKFVGYQGQFESGASIEAISKAAAKKLGHDLPPSQDPFKLFSWKRGSAGATVERMATKHMLDLWGNPVGPSLEQALAPVKGQRGEFLLYLFARRAIERWGRGMNPGISLEDANYIKQTYDKPEFQLSAQGYYDWWDGVLNYIIQADPAMTPMIQKIRAGSTDYAPLARMIDPAKAKKAAAQAKSNPLMKMHGSGLPVKDIFDQTFINAARLINTANRSLVARNIIRLSEIQGLGHIVEEIPRSRVREIVNVELIRKQLEDMGVDTTPIPQDELLQYFTPADVPKGTAPIITYKDAAGKTKWYEVDPQLYDQLEGLQTFSLQNSFPGIPYLGKMLDLVLGTPARAFRLGTTGLRPAFSLVTNPARDLATLIAQTSSNPAKVAAMYPAALADAIRGGTYKNVFYDLGAHLGQPLGTDIGHTKRVSKELFHGRIMRVVNNPIDHLRELLSITESAPRIAELKAVADDIGWKPGQPLLPDQAVQLAIAAKRVTVDFSAAGDVSRILNQAIPFYNPSVQGLRSFARAFATNPKKATLVGLAMFTAPALFLWWKNKDEEWYRALPNRERYLYSNIDDGKNVWRIPRPFEWGNVFMVAPEAIFDTWYRHEPEEVKKAIGHIFETTMPADYPVVLKMAKEQWQNRIEFWDRPIVPRGEVDLPASEQVGPYTSRLAVAVNKAFPDLSPRRIDAAIRSYFGGVGTDAMDLLGLGAKKSEKEFEASDFPVFGTLFRRGGEFNAQNQNVNDFWDAYLASKSRMDAYHYATGQIAKGVRKPGSVKAPNSSDERIAAIGAGISKEIRFLLMLANRTNDNEARREIYKQINQIVMRGLDDFRKSKEFDK